MVSLLDLGIILFFITFNLSAVYNQQFSIRDPNWCPSATSNLDIPLNNYTILFWGTNEKFGQRIRECKWSIHLKQARRVRFDITGLTLYTSQCYQSYISGISQCSDSITVYYGECTPDKQIIKYQGTNNKPRSFVGYTDTLCFHFIPNTNPSLSGSFYAKTFYLRIGVSLLEKTCLYNNTERGLCYGVCHANGTKIPYSCQGNDDNKGHQVSPTQSQLTTPETSAMLSSQFIISSVHPYIDTQSLVSPPYETVEQTYEQTSESKSQSSVSPPHETVKQTYSETSERIFLTTDFSSFISSQPVSYSPSYLYPSVNFNVTMATFLENETLTTTHCTSYQSYMDSVSVLTSDSFLSESYQLFTDEMTSGMKTPIPVKSESQWSTIVTNNTMNGRKVTPTSSRYDVHSTSKDRVTLDFNAHNITTQPPHFISFGITIGISSTVKQESSRDVSHNSSAIRPTPTVTQGTPTQSSGAYNFVSIISEVLTTESVSRNDNTVSKHDSSQSKDIDDQTLIVVTTVVGVVFVTGIFLTVACLIQRQRRGEGRFGSDTHTVYHNTDDALWRQNWTVKKTFNDVWMPSTGDKPSPPSREVNTPPPLTEQHSKLSRKRTLSCSDDSTDHECGLYDVTGMTTRDYISCMNEDQQKRDQTNYIQCDTGRLETGQLYTQIKK